MWKWPQKDQRNHYVYKGLAARVQKVWFFSKMKNIKLCKISQISQNFTKNRICRILPCPPANFPATGQRFGSDFSVKLKINYFYHENEIIQKICAREKYFPQNSWWFYSFRHFARNVVNTKAKSMIFWSKPRKSHIFT